MVVDIGDVITWFKFGDDRFRSLASAEGQILPFPIDFDGRPYNTLTLPCERVIMEKTVVREFIYPAFQKPTTSLTFHDQFAFKPTGSTTAAIISLFHKVTHLLLTNPYVIVIALDLSKAFDTVRRHTLIDKMAQLDLPDHVGLYTIGWFTSLRPIHTKTKYQ